MDMALQQSLQENQMQQIYTQEPLSTEARERKSKDEPVGLKNVGNTCYFNSLMQLYFSLPWFTTEIFKHNADKVKYPDKPSNPFRLQQSRVLIEQL